MPGGTLPKHEITTRQVIGEDRTGPDPAGMLEVELGR